MGMTSEPIGFGIGIYQCLVYWQTLKNPFAMGTTVDAVEIRNLKNDCINSFTLALNIVMMSSKLRLILGEQHEFDYF